MINESLEKRIQREVVNELDDTYGDGMRDAAIDMVKASIVEAFKNIGSKEDADKMRKEIEEEAAKHWRHYWKGFL